MKKKIYELLRNHVARMATGNLGKVLILDEEIVCFVDGRKLKKKEKYLHRYNLMFKMIAPEDELYKIYRVDKPVHYIIKNVDFDMEINIRASMKNCKVTFENCTFTAAIEIDFADHIRFINNTYNAQTYNNYRSIYKKGEFCISTRTDKSEINKIEFFMDNIAVEDIPTIPTMRVTDIGKKASPKQNKKPTIQIWLYGREIELFSTDIVDAKSINIGTDKLALNGTNVRAEEIEIHADNIELYCSEIASDVISVDIDKYSYVRKPDKPESMMIKSNSLFVNGVEINKNEKEIDYDSLELQQKRLELINTFKKIERTSEEKISEEIRKQPLTRILKK